MDDWPQCGMHHPRLEVVCRTDRDHEGWHEGVDAAGKSHYWPYSMSEQ